jgi:hypothetical protein
VLCGVFCLSKRHKKIRNENIILERFKRIYLVLRGQREREREREEHGVRELQIDSSDIDEIVGRRIVGFEERRGRTSGTKCEWNAFVRFQFDTNTNVEDDDEGETVALETTSVPAQLTQKWVRS